MLICRILIVAACLYLLPLYGCRNSESRLAEFLPSNSNMIIFVNWSAVRKDEGLKRVINSQMYEAQIRRFGIEEAKLAELAVFGMIRAETQGGLIFRGSFDAPRTLAALKSQGWSEDLIEGRKVYSSGKDFAAAPADDILVAGTREGVAASLRVLKNSRENLSTSASFKKMRSTLLESKSPVTAFMLAPDNSNEVMDSALSIAGGALSLFDAGGIADVLKKLNIASGIGFAIARGKNGNCAVRFSVLFRDEKTAEIAADSMSILKELSTLASARSGSTEDQQAIRDFSVTREKEVLLLKMQMPESALTPPPNRSNQRL
jgi:hypothetical protein